jgi:serine phosphatase RsbU (regulator of sigma subunit)
MNSKIKTWLNKNTNNITLFKSGIVFILLLVNFYFIFLLLPTSNDECLWIPKKDKTGVIKFYFDKVKFEGVTWNAGIRDGDILISINDVPMNSTKNAMDVINKMNKGEKAKYVIERNGEKIVKYVEIKKLINYQSLSVTLLSFIWLIVGTLVLIAKNNGKTQKLFYEIGILFSISSLYYMLWGTESQNPTFKYFWTRYLIDIVWTLAASFLPFKWLHLFLIFPIEHKLYSKRWVNRFLKITPIIVFAYTIIIRLTMIYLNAAGGVLSYPNLIAAPLYVINIWALITGLVLLFNNYFKLPTKAEKNSIFIILVGYTIGVLTIVYLIVFSANATTDVQFNSPMYFTPIIMIVLIPISFAYSIFKYSLMDMTDVFKTTIIYVIATISVAVVYFFIIYVIGFSISSAIGTKYQGIIAGIIFIFFALIFQSTKDRFQEVITQRLYPEQFAFRKILVKFSTQISTVVGLENILEFTNKIFVEALRLNKFAIVLFDEERKKYYYKKGRGIDEKEFIINCVENRLKNKLNAKEKVGLIPVIDKTEFEEVFPLDADKLENEKIFTIVPLRTQNKIIGLLLFGLKYSGSQFNDTDLELLLAAANQTSVSIENARLYAIELENIKYEQELANARKIQESLLPKAIPRISGLDITGVMIPAMHIGGDYFDIIEVSSSKAFVVVGDVAGKGLSASFYMSKLQTMIRLFCKESNSPKEILVKINKLISNEIDKHSFITVILALFDTENKTITLSRAGHPPLIKFDGLSHVFYQPKGMGLGLEKGVLFEQTLEEVIIPFDKEETFIFFSDGVNEAMNEKGELFGINNLVETVNMHRSEKAVNIKNAILSSIKFFTGNAETNDDITLVVVKTR